MPYFVKLTVEPLKIQLVQIGTTYDFEGHAVDKDGNVPKIKANFDATLSCSLTRLPDGDALQGDGGKWTCTVTPTQIDKLVQYDLDAYVKVKDANMNAWPECENRQVANVELWIIPR
jgi:hypothetical protein